MLLKHSIPLVRLHLKGSNLELQRRCGKTREASAFKSKSRVYASHGEKVRTRNRIHPAYARRSPRMVVLTGAQDNHMINGTKLLNVAGMTRGRRDGILKSEKVRHVVKIGPMHLKGVW